MKKQFKGLGWYFHLFNYVALLRLKKNDIDPRKIHTQIVVVLSTGVLMWAYAILAYFTISSPIPGIVGAICAIIHIFSPLLFRVTNNSFLAANVLLAAGCAHQATFAYFSGGFHSPLLIWFGILPMIGGVISGRKGAVTWMIITVLLSLVFLILHNNGYQFPYEISEFGKHWAQALLVFGWIFLSSTIVIVYAGLGEYTENKLKSQSDKIDDLFRVLFHDLANPLGRIAIGLTIAKKQNPDGENRGLEIAKQATDAMMEITQNIRKMYAVSKGKANVDLVLFPLNSSIEYVQKIYHPELDKKQISLKYNYEANSGLSLVVEPVSFNNQVLGNIVSNAIKFSPPGSKIELSAYPINQNTFKLEIKDEGLGIPKSQIGNLFDISKKTTRPGTSGELGTGFGMHIMKTFVEMYGGQVVVESTEEQGSSVQGTTIKLILKGHWA
jgi:signal transduction histidine kinase